MQAVARFRMGVHWLNSECLRKGADGKLVPRSNRLCPCCSAGAREDERHVFECPHYQEIKSHYDSELFIHEAGGTGVRDDDHMKRLMNGDGSRSFWNRLANYLLACKRSRARALTLNSIADM